MLVVQLGQSVHVLGILNVRGEERRVEDAAWLNSWLVVYVRSGGRSPLTLLCTAAACRSVALRRADAPTERHRGLGEEPEEKN